MRLHASTTTSIASVPSTTADVRPARRGRSWLRARRALSWYRPGQIENVDDACSRRPRRGRRGRSWSCPGKLDVLARVPQSRLKSVVLPVLGLPMSAMRAVSGRRVAHRPAPRDGLRVAVRGRARPSTPRSRARPGCRRPPTRDRPIRVDCTCTMQGSPDLADAQHAAVGQAERTEQRAVLRGQVGRVQPRDIAGDHLGETAPATAAAAATRGLGRIRHGQPRAPNRGPITETDLVRTR